MALLLRVLGWDPRSQGEHGLHWLDCKVKLFPVVVRVRVLFGGLPAPYGHLQVRMEGVFLVSRGVAWAVSPFFRLDSQSGHVLCFS